MITQHSSCLTSVYTVGSSYNNLIWKIKQKMFMLERKKQHYLWVNEMILHREALGGSLTKMCYLQKKFLQQDFRNQDQHIK